MSDFRKDLSMSRVPLMVATLVVSSGGVLKRWP